jgi:hypothetical protein
VRHLRGNQPKLQYQYLCLRHSGKLPEFLKFYPEIIQDNKVTELIGRFKKAKNG